MKRSLLFYFIFILSFSNVYSEDDKKPPKAILVNDENYIDGIEVLKAIPYFGVSPSAKCPDGFSKTAPDKSTEIIKFPNNVSMKITMPDLECPQELVKGKICYSSDKGGGNIILDPGHDLSTNSCRNGHHDEVHEGQGNMVMAMIARQLLLKCAKYDEKDKSGIKPNAIKLSYYPGAINYGDFTNGTLPTSLKKGKVSTAQINSKGGSNLFNHINKITTNKGRTTIISVHQEAPDYASEANRKSEYPAVYFRRTRKNSAALAVELYSSVVAHTSKYYTEKQRSTFEVTSTIKDQHKIHKIIFGEKGTSTQTTYPHLTMAGYKDNNSFETIIDGKKAKFKTKAREVAQVMRAGNKAGDFKYEKYSSKKESGKVTKLNSDPEKTEVVLVETLFMDGYNVGARVQRELSDYLYDDKMKVLLDENKKPKKKAAKDMPPEIQIEYSTNKEEKWNKVQFTKPIIVKRAPKKGESKSQIYYHHKDGPKRDGLRISNVHIDVAKGIVAGIQKRFSCKSK